MKTVAFILFIIYTAPKLSAQIGIYEFMADKVYYNGTESMEAKISIRKKITKRENEFCYLQLLDNRQTLVKEKVLRLSDELIAYNLTLADVDTGIYYLRILNSNRNFVSAIWIGVNIPDRLQNRNVPPTLTLYPEGGRALTGFTQTFFGSLLSPVGAPLQRTILVRNKKNQLIAAAKTNNAGQTAIKIPLLKDDLLTISTTSGETLGVYNTSDTVFSKEKGFAIQAGHTEGQLLAEAWRGILEPKNNMKLQLYFNDKLLFETPCIFRGDTNIVATSFPMENLRNRLLNLVLTDSNNNVYANRHYFITENSQEPYLSFLPEELQFLDTQNNLSDINNRLIAFSPIDNVKPAQGFSLFFQNKNMPNTLLSYAVMNEQNGLLQAGQIETNDSGIIELTEFVFTGQAYVQFYIKGKAVNGFRTISNPIIPLYEQQKKAEEINRLLLAGTDSIDKKENQHIIEIMENNKEFTLEEVNVSSTKKTRIEELEEVYVSNGMFRDINSIGIDVEADNFARNYGVATFVLKYIPGLTVGLKYRGGYIDAYLDETPIDLLQLGEIFMGDIAYIKFFRTPVRGGMAAQRGGALMRGDSYAAGLQGSLALYTKKYIEKSNPTTGNKGIVVNGYAN
jgi:hypothetical protein